MAAQPGAAAVAAARTVPLWEAEISGRRSERSPGLAFCQEVGSGAMDCEGGTKGAEVNINDFFHRTSVSACECPSDWDAVAAGEFEDKAIAGFEVVGPEIERGVWVIAEGIGTSLVKEYIGRGGMEKTRKILLKKFEKLGAIGFCG